MTEPDARITAAWDGGPPPPARDALFRIAIMERIERRRYRASLAILAALALIVTAAFRAVLPGLAGALHTATVPTGTFAGAALAIAAACTLWGLNRVYRLI